MSALLAHAKAARILAKSFDRERRRQTPGIAMFCDMMRLVYEDAASNMEMLARSECTGEPEGTKP